MKNIFKYFIINFLVISVFNLPSFAENLKNELKDRVYEKDNFKNSDKKSTADSLYKIAKLHAKNGENLNALAYFQRSLNLYNNLNLKQNIIENYRNIGYICKEQRRYNEAKENYINAVKNIELIILNMKPSEKVNFMKKTFFIFKELNQVLIELEEFDKVEEYQDKFSLALANTKWSIPKICPIF